MGCNVVGDGEAVGSGGNGSRAWWCDENVRRQDPSYGGIRAAWGKQGGLQFLTVITSVGAISYTDEGIWSCINTEMRKDEKRGDRRRRERKKR